MKENSADLQVHVSCVFHHAEKTVYTAVYNFVFENGVIIWHLQR